MLNGNRLSGVYAIIHQPSGRAYVGSSRNIFRRWRCHANWLNTGKHHAAALLDAWLSDGAAAFTFVVLEQCAPEALREREQEWLDSFEAPLNTSKNTRCPMFDPAVAARQGAKMRGRKFSAEHCANLSASHKGIPSPTKGCKRTGFVHKWSQEDREKISARLQGHPVSEESRAKMRAAKAAMSVEARAACQARRLVTIAGRKNPAIAESNRRRWREGYRIIVRDPVLWRARLSASHMGQSRPCAAETKRKMAETHIANAQRKRSMSSLIAEDTDA